ncbi:unnamed protein product [Gongylonema pulchrum]|uniref:FBD domain-containing protein n=1 Tax=Gongylonema pulchrum TaxID=637853 RepID=A0A183DVU9_9BILA|nr:unnamed protein product [Gongylonema pulchrum]
MKPLRNTALSLKLLIGPFDIEVVVSNRETSTDVLDMHFSWINATLPAKLLFRHQLKGKLSITLCDLRSSDLSVCASENVTQEILAIMWIALSPFPAAKIRAVNRRVIVHWLLPLDAAAVRSWSFVGAWEEKYLCEVEVEDSILMKSMTGKSPCKLAAENKLRLVVLDHKNIDRIGDKMKFASICANVREVS